MYDKKILSRHLKGKTLYFASVLGVGLILLWNLGFGHRRSETRLSCLYEENVSNVVAFSSTVAIQNNHV